VGLLARLSRMVRHGRREAKRSSKAGHDGLRRCRFEAMEPRQMLSADPLRIGAVYVEDDIGSDIHGDTFHVTFEGGAPGTN